MQFFINNTKIILTRCQILHLKCIKFDFGNWGANSTPPDPYLDLGREKWNKDRRGRKEEGRERDRDGKGKRREREWEKGGKGRGWGFSLPYLLGVRPNWLREKQSCVVCIFKNSIELRQGM